MIQVGSQLHVTDNSGAKKVECIKVFNKTKQRVGHVGQLVLVVSKNSIRNKHKK